MIIQITNRVMWLMIVYTVDLLISTTISDELIAIPDFIFVIAFETVSSVLK